MAIIPGGQKIHTISADVDTTERGSALVNSGREIYTMDDIVETVGGGGGGGSGITLLEVEISATELKSGTDLVVLSGTAGVYREVVHVSMEYVFNTTAMSGKIGNYELQQGAGRYWSLSTFNMGSSDEAYMISEGNNSEEPLLENVDMVFAKPATPYTTGDGTLKILVRYYEWTAGL